jgi:hypothetical protein
VTTETDLSTTTISAPVVQRAKRVVDYPAWLPESYATTRVSSACNYLSVPLSVATGTATADPILVTVPMTDTETVTNTVRVAIVADGHAGLFQLTHRHRGVIEIQFEFRRKDHSH